MNREQRLILQNQKALLRFAFRNCNIDEVSDDLRRQYSLTSLALTEWEVKSEDHAQ